MEQNSPFNDFNKYVGKQISKARKLRNISQEKLGQSLKKPISCQQIQKYEKGRDNISFSKIVEITHILKMPIGYFLPQEFYHFEGDVELIADFYAVSLSSQKTVIGLLKNLKGV